MSEENKIPYLVENKERDTFTIYVKGTKPYLDLQQRIDKAIKYIKLATDNITEYLDIKEIKELLEILGDKEC